MIHLAFPQVEQTFTIVLPYGCFMSRTKTLPFSSFSMIITSCDWCCCTCCITTTMKLSIVASYQSNDDKFAKAKVNSDDRKTKITELCGTRNPHPRWMKRLPRAPLWVSYMRKVIGAHSVGWKCRFFRHPIIAGELPWAAYVSVKRSWKKTEEEDLMTLENFKVSQTTLHVSDSSSEPVDSETVVQGWKVIFQLLATAGV